MTDFCKLEGCNKRVYQRGYCNAHYKRLWRHGDPLKGRTPQGEPINWLLSHVDYKEEDCLLWPYGKYSNGYARVNVPGKRDASAANFMCRKAHGEPPSEEHEAAHSCGMGHIGCINPRHLSWKTKKENNQEKIVHGTSGRGEKHNLSKLTEHDVHTIRALKGKKTQSQIAAAFGVTQTTISHIHRGKSWGWLPARGCSTSA